MQLMIEEGPRAGQSLPLSSSEMSVGRGGDNDVVLPEQGVSRLHASLQRNQSGWSVVDLASTNGTFVNGQRLRPHEARLLQVGDRFSIGSSVLVLDLGEAPPGGQASADPGSGSSSSPSKRHHPALLVLGVICLIVVLVGIVFVLVTVLQPAEAPPTATAVEPGQYLLTALPLPTGFDDIVTAVAPLLPTGMNLPFLGGTPTPTP
jgi:hypothetical protein